MNKRERAVVTAGVATLLFSWMLLRILPSMGDAAENRRDELELMQDQLLSLRGLASSAGKVAILRDSAAARLLDFAPLLIDGTTAAAAGASLVGRINGAADRARVRIVRLEPLDDSLAAGFRRSSVRAEAESDIRGLVSWLVALEGGQPRVRVERLRVQPQSPTVASDGPEMLRLELIAAAWSVAEDEP